MSYDRRQPYEHKDGTCTIFENDKKVTAEDADYYGEGKLNGQLVSVKGWAKTTKKGTDMIRLSIRPKTNALKEFVGYTDPEPDKPRPF